MNVDKEHLLNTSKTFCILPWLHVNVTPKGDAYPCCATDYSESFGNTNKDSLQTIFNNDKMKKLRLDMLADNQSSVCRLCYDQEKYDGQSFRKNNNKIFKNHIDKLLNDTNDDGSVSTFNLHYLDIRFRNICNFKCRYCGSDNSSQIAAEERQYTTPDRQILLQADSSGRLLEEVKAQLHNVELAYFAGGEPLIMDEHYVILEELIRLGKTDITLMYSSNCSNTIYKSFDLYDLWSHFRKIRMCASVDHYGERAEYMRNGTDWGKVETNILKFQNLPNMDFKMHSVISIFNYVTIDEWHEYMLDKGLIRYTDYFSNSFAMTSFPNYACARNLPENLKYIGNIGIDNFIAKHSTCDKIHDLLKIAKSYTNAENNWETYKTSFQQATRQRDMWRDEDFVKVFPELTELME